MKNAKNKSAKEEIDSLNEDLKNGKYPPLVVSSVELIITVFIFLFFYILMKIFHLR